MDRTTLSRPWRKLPFGGLSANALRLIAMVGMLLDHVWGTLLSGGLWMTCVGRLVFPIYAFQLTEGFFRTAHRKQYLRRLLVFALISEIPFNFMMAGGWLYPFHQNTIFTLALGLWAVSILEELRDKRVGLGKGLLLLAAAALLSVVGFPDYGWQGVLTVVLFYVMRGHRLAWLGQLAGMVVIHCFLFEGQTLPWLFDLPLQSFAVLALIPIWLYNGQLGRGGKTFRQAAYWYYPLHMIALAIIRRMI